MFRCPTCGRWNRVDPTRGSPRCGGCKASLPTDGRVVHATDAELRKLVEGSPVPVLVDFYADWCGPCQSLSPILAELGRKYAGRLVVAKVDTERDKQTASALGVSGIPAVFVYRGGRVVANATGLRPLGAWEQLVAPHLA